MSSGDDITEDVTLTKDVIVTPLEDMLVEGTESYILSIEMVSVPATLLIGTTNTITVNIADNESKDWAIPFFTCTPPPPADDKPLSR